MAVKKTAKIEKGKTSKTKTASKKEKEKAAALAVPQEAPRPLAGVPVVEDDLGTEVSVQVPPAAETKETEPEAEKGKPEKYYEAVGRRKSAIARVRLFTKGSEIVVNSRPFQDYFSIPELQQIVEAPFRKMKNLGKFRTEIKVVGGGIKGQAEAARHGVSRALTMFNADFRKRLKKAGYLTRDARVKERKKYGLKGARRAPQWSKR